MTINEHFEQEVQGAYVVDAVCGIQKIGAQIEALADLFEVVLARDLPAHFRNRGMTRPVRALYLSDDGPDPSWVYRRWLYQYVVAGGGDKRLHNPIYVALDFILYDEAIMSVVGKRPVIFVAGNTEGKWDKSIADDFQLDAQFLKADQWEGYAGGRLWWNEGEGGKYWCYCVPLFAISNEHAVRELLVKPVMELAYLSRFGNNHSDSAVERAITDLPAVLAFELDGDTVLLKPA